MLFKPHGISYQPSRTLCFYVCIFPRRYPPRLYTKQKNGASIHNDTMYMCEDHVYVSVLINHSFVGSVSIFGRLPRKGTGVVTVKNFYSSTDRIAYDNIMVCSYKHCTIHSLRFVWFVVVYMTVAIHRKASIQVCPTLHVDILTNMRCFRQYLLCTTWLQWWRLTFTNIWHMRCYMAYA